MSPWISVEERMPEKGDGDAHGCVLVWHAYQGVMVTGWHNVPNNRYHTHWMPPPGAPEAGQKK